MRGEEEMYDLILETVREDERIRAVYMNGSRTNPNVPKDIFQDYDVVYVVRETESFIADRTWIDRFGERLFMQYPDENPHYPSDVHNCYGWLIQFADGNRLDLHVESIPHAQENILKDSLCKVLLDKDGLLPVVPPSTERDYLIEKPDEARYLGVCNEFWWCLDNVAKGLFRGEMPYVQDMLNFVIRKQLESMLSWKAGILTDFSVSAGKSGKYLYRYLSGQEWQEYLATYCSAKGEECWESVMTMCALFERTAVFVGEKLGYSYNAEEGKNCRAYLEHVRRLPKDATEIY